VRHHQTFAAAAAVFALAACKENSETHTVDGWLGEPTHLAISGSYQGTVFDVDLKGDTAAGVRCVRFYTPIAGTQPDAAGNYDTSQLYFVMMEIGALIDVEGSPKQFTIAYWRHDMGAGTDLQVVGRTFGTTIPSGQTWSDINVFDPGTDILSGIESAAESGTVSMKLNTGVADANGIFKPTGGRTGAYYDVSWGPDDNLNVSASADCLTAPLALWAQSRIMP
jgi:hypothetical protein